MEALLALLFGAGIALGLLMAIVYPKKPRCKPNIRRKEYLDSVDEMFLYGEVNNDDFYKM